MAQDGEPMRDGGDKEDSSGLGKASDGEARNDAPHAAPDDRRWLDNGWILYPNLVASSELAGTYEEACRIFPSLEEYSVRPAVCDQLRSSEFAAMAPFPFQGGPLSLLAVNHAVIAHAARLLGDPHPLLYQAQLWAKYAGLLDYEQTHHRDFAKNTMLSMDTEETADFVEVFIYLRDVNEEDGPTALVPRALTKSLPSAPSRYTRREAPELYEAEELAVGCPGTALFYAGDVFHRGCALKASSLGRMTLKLAFKRRDATWVTYATGLGVGFEPGWSTFVRSADAVQRAVVGFPVYCSSPRLSRYVETS